MTFTKTDIVAINYLMTYLSPIRPKFSIFCLTTASSVYVGKEVDQSKCVVVLPQCSPMLQTQGSETCVKRQ